MPYKSHLNYNPLKIIIIITFSFANNSHFVGALGLGI